MLGRGCVAAERQFGQPVEGAAVSHHHNDDPVPIESDENKWKCVDDISTYLDTNSLLDVANMIKDTASEEEQVCEKLATLGFPARFVSEVQASRFVLRTFFQGIVGWYQPPRLLGDEDDTGYRMTNLTGDDPGGAYHGEIYNPFTPVVSPTTEAAPTRIDKMYIQTASGYRPVDNSYQHQYSHHRHHHHLHPHHHLHQLQLNRSRGDPESNNFTISTAVHLSCAVQRAWLHMSSICHGLLGGLALAHLLLICTTKPYDWVEASIRHYSAFAEVYANTFYCLAIICMVSIFDRMDISHFSLSGAAESNISFRSVVIIMIYAATIILSLSAGSMDERLYLSTANVTVWEEELETNKILSIWNTLSIARSVGAIFGWVVIGMSPEQDQLYEHLLEMEKYQLQ